MKIAIVYTYESIPSSHEEVPENIKLYVEDVTSEEWERIKLTHGNFVNLDMTEEESDACIWLSTWLEKKTNIPSDQGAVPLTGIEFLVITGFML